MKLTKTNLKAKSIFDSTNPLIIFELQVIALIGITFKKIAEPVQSMIYFELTTPVIANFYDLRYGNLS